jgi:uncharacterized protein YggU (UPF0235/DUF167 family)
MQRVKVKVTPGARREHVAIEGDVLMVYVREPAQNGLATQRVKTLVARHFAVDISKVRLLTGAQSRTKAFVIET